MRLPCFLFWVLAALTSSGAGPAGLNAPVKKFRLPAFNDEGFRSSLLQGDEATMVSTSQIDIKEMQFTLFAGDEKGSVDTKLEAPVATVLILDQNQILVEGAGSVHLARNDLSASGEDWSYRHSEKRLIIRKNVHLVIRAQLGDILK